MNLNRISNPAGVVTYQSPQLNSIGIRHAFSTRVGGVSPGPFDSMNLGNPSGVAAPDTAVRIAENYARLMAAIGCPGANRYFAHQMHGPEVAIVDSVEFSCHQKADALVTALPGSVVSVRVADCCPVLVASADGKAVAATHAGWRGTVSGVVPATVAAILRLSGTKPADLVAAVGPCIGVDAFEVGAEVLAAFDNAFGPDAPIRRRSDGKGHADIAAGCRLQLIRAGIPADRIDTTDRCTFRDEAEFFSHRRDHGVTGRMAALIATR